MNVKQIEIGRTFSIETENGTYLLKETRSTEHHYTECVVYTEDGNMIEDMELISELYNAVRNSDVVNV